MKIYRGEELQRLVKQHLVRAQVERARLIQPRLTEFLNNEQGKVNICALYGLRRTGKTVMMYREIQSRNAKDCLLISCYRGDEYIDIEKEINDAEEKLIFVDEITKVNNFLLLASSLFDEFPDKKIVISGTDSASLLFAGETELLDRQLKIHTSYISFKEYNYLLNRSIEDYIRYGGLLTNGLTPYNDDNKDSIDEYINSAIVSNILHSVEYAKEETPYRRLRDLYISGELEAAINKTIEYRAREFVISIMQGPFTKSHYFGSAKDLMIKARDSYSTEEFSIINKWNSKEVSDYIIKKINLNAAPNINESDITLITNLLKKMDVLQEVDKQIIFTQPGMQYAFADVLISGIVRTGDFMKLYPGTQKLLLEKIEQDSIGKILENVIKNELIKLPELKNYEIGHLDNTGNGEFDLYVISPENANAVVFEIKRSLVRDYRQRVHLCNESFCSEFEETHNCRIVNRVVIYQGETCSIEDGKELINYYNAEEFLLNPIPMLFGPPLIPNITSEVDDDIQI